MVLYNHCLKAVRSVWPTIKIIVGLIVASVGPMDLFAVGATVVPYSFSYTVCKVLHSVFTGHDNTCPIASLGGDY